MRILRKLLVGNKKMDVMSFPASPEAIELQEKVQRGMLAALSGEEEIHVRVKDSEKTKRQGLIALFGLYQLRPRSVRRNMDDELSAAERQMIEILREWAGDPGTYRLTIEYTNGEYEIEFSMPNRGGRAARGVGRTLSEAWGNVAPSWA